MIGQWMAVTSKMYLYPYIKWCVSYGGWLKCCILNSYNSFTHILQSNFIATVAIMWLSHCW